MLSETEWDKKIEEWDEEVCVMEAFVRPDVETGVNKPFAYALKRCPYATDSVVRELFPQLK